jgi:hypothetical protein
MMGWRASRIVVSTGQRPPEEAMLPGLFFYFVAGSPGPPQCAAFNFPRQKAWQLNTAVNKTDSTGLSLNLRKMMPLWHPGSRAKTRSWHWTGRLFESKWPESELLLSANAGRQSSGHDPEYRVALQTLTQPGQADRDSRASIDILEAPKFEKRHSRRQSLFAASRQPGKL